MLKNYCNDTLMETTMTKKPACTPAALHKFLQDQVQVVPELIDLGAFESADCNGCNGKGKYVGFRVIEDPCSKCGGSGKWTEGMEGSGFRVVPIIDIDF